MLDDTSSWLVAYEKGEGIISPDLGAFIYVNLLILWDMKGGNFTKKISVSRSSCLQLAPSFNLPPPL